jgi:hypothetical protein
MWLGDAHILSLELDAETPHGHRGARSVLDRIEDAVLGNVCTV